MLSIGVAIYIVNRAVTRQARCELQRGIDEAATLVDQYRKFCFETFGREARLIADLPVLKAAVDTGDPATLEPIAREYQSQLANADLFAIADNRGRCWCGWARATCPTRRSPPPPPSAGPQPIERDAFWPEQHGILLIKSVPIWIDKRQPDVLGTLILGASLDYRQASAVQDADEQRDRVRRQRRASRPPRCPRAPGRRSRRCSAARRVGRASR